MATPERTAIDDPTKSATATVTIQQSVTISVGPDGVSLSSLQTAQFTATVGNAANTAVTWSLSSAVGSISAGGLYTAPSLIGSQRTLTIKATSAADTTKFASVIITLLPVSVTVSPLTSTLIAGQTQQFTATILGSANTAVTWSLSSAVGTISAAGLYTAPSPASSVKVTVKATSIADPTKSAGATVTLLPLSEGVLPAKATVGGGQSQQFVATITNSSNPAVTWSISPLTGAIDATGRYVAPAVITAQQTVTVKATAVGDPTKSATATVTLVPLSVAMSPAKATLNITQTQQFAATIANSVNTAVTWSISPVVGTLDVTGLYTAPASIVSQQNITVKATSLADPTKSASATVTLVPVGVSISPTKVTLNISQTQQFTAAVTNAPNTSVTWSLTGVGAGTISNTGLYTAPVSIASQQTVTVTATSLADPTKSASATITLVPVKVTVTPATATLTSAKTQQFTAALTGTSNTAVTWSLSGTGTSLGSISTVGLYTAPTVTAKQTITVKATSVADPTKSTMATVTVNP